MQKIVGALQRFNRSGGWYYIPVSRELSTKYQKRAQRGLVAITARVENITWNTSLLPMGDGSHFVPIPQKVRAKYCYDVGDLVEVHVELR